MRHEQTPRLEYFEEGCSKRYYLMTFWAIPLKSK